MLSVIMLSIILLSVIMLNVIMLIVIMLNVDAPLVPIWPLRRRRRKKTFFNISASSAGFGGGLRQLFHMEVRDRESGELLQNQTSEDPNFTIK
jgi:hypothetical protein